MNDVAKRGIGCGVLCLLFVVGILALPSEKFAAIMAWAILFSIPMGIARFLSCWGLPCNWIPLISLAGMK